MPERQSPKGRGSCARHLARGTVGFSLIVLALACAARFGPAALLIAVPGLVALRGCPMCWIAGLIEIVSAGRAERSCDNGSCTLRAPPSQL